MCASSFSYLLPPGKYFIGDPQQVIEKNWELVLRNTNFFRCGAPIMIQGSSIWGLNTATDRNQFIDQNGVDYPTVGGVLGAVPIELVENPEGEEYGTMLDAPCGLLVGYDEGVFRFGDIVIDTNPPDTNFGELDFGNGHDLDLNDDKFI